jgi:hypothetical protein
LEDCKQLSPNRKGKLIACVVFDAAGRDYLGSLPFSAEEEREVISDMLKLLDVGKL